MSFWDKDKSFLESPQKKNELFSEILNENF